MKRRFALLFSAMLVGALCLGAPALAFAEEGDGQESAVPQSDAAARASGDFVDPYQFGITGTGLDEGNYYADVTLGGDTGQVSVTSPATLSVHYDHVVATIEWSSSNYDYMAVDGVKYYPTSKEGENSTFIIPVIKFDEPFTVIGHTTAMLTPREIEYTLTFDRSSVMRPSALDDSANVDWGLLALVSVGLIVAAALCVFIGIKMRVGFDTDSANSRSGNRSNKRRRR